jgi:hypothetical protein
MENSNTQTQQPVPPAPPAGQSVEEVKAQLQAEFDKTREGLIRDLQQERAKRQELESRLQPPAPSPANQDVSQDELAKVLNPYLAPVLKETAAIRAQLEEERAKSVLSTRAGKSWKEIEADKGLQEKLTDVARRYRLAGSSDQVVVKAYDIMELEDLKAKQAERERTTQAASQASMPSGAPPAPAVSGTKYSADSFNKMHWKQFDELSSKGSFRKVGDEFIYTPK